MTTTTPLPDWVSTIRPHQVTAVDQAMEAFGAGADVVFMDAPTGSGKTLIGELIRRRMPAGSRVVYVCNDKTLQAQFLRDFPYAKVLMGKANYPTEYNQEKTCDDCTANGPQDQCMWCDGHQSCPYQVAKREALTAELAVVNTSYLLSEANFVGKFSGFDLIIIDEADTLEGILMGFVQYEVPKYVARELNLKYPVKGARKPTIIKWLDELAVKAADHARRQATTMEPKVLRRWKSFAAETSRVADELRKDIAAGTEDVDHEADDSGRWLRDYDSETFCLKPVMVASYGAKNLWRHGRKFLLMSATVVSADEMADSLGLPLDWEVVSVPMTFPVENRPVVLAPVADVTFKNQDRAVTDLTYAIWKIIERHQGERILVHTVSYNLNRRLVDAMKSAPLGVAGHGRLMVTYNSAKERDAALARFLASDAGVLFAPSMERGVDLKGDAARVVVVAKCPFPALGDRRVKARQMLPGGQQWYMVQTVRDIVQMTGRAVRSETDWAVTYILDAQFTRNVWRNKFLFPRWWTDAVDEGADVRWLMPPKAKSIR